jgi:hypothetical protein
VPVSFSPFLDSPPYNIGQFFASWLFCTPGRLQAAGLPDDYSGLISGSFNATSEKAKKIPSAI